MKNIHLFDNVDSFADAYANRYSEPWVSYTRESKDVEYNRKYDVYAVSSEEEGIGYVVLYAGISCSDLDNHENIYSASVDGIEYEVKYDDGKYPAWYIRYDDFSNPIGTLYCSNGVLKMEPIHK